MKKIFSLIAALAALAAAAEWREPMIPSLDWEMRSDWTSVKTPQTWHGQTAGGDGESDDTSAIQLAIAAADPKGGTVYLPPGRYRITRPLTVGTLRIASDTRPEGFSIIGHGRDTVIVWDGPEGEPMVQLTGIAFSRIVGVTFDGAGRAGSVFRMGGPGFQSHNLFRHCAFLNAGYGIESGVLKMNTACTEQRIDNCLFENCGTGILLGDFNDYDCVIEGCEFRECGYGVRTDKGNFYARDCHFENSLEADFSNAGEHTSTIRRCTSVGADRFLIQRSGVSSTVIQDCRVAYWRNPEGAVWQNGVPAVVTDCWFTGDGGTVFRFAPDSAGQKFVTSGNFYDNCSLCSDPAVITGADIPVSGEVPAAPITAETSFLKTRAIHGVWTDEPYTACIPGKIFDVQRDFGAKGGEADDTASFKAAVKAAREHGQGAMVYIPRGHWTVTETIELEGGDYYFGGSGLRTWFSWYGPENGTLIHVKPAGSIALEGFQIFRMGGRKDGIDILHTGSPDGGGSLRSSTRCRSTGFSSRTRTPGDCASATWGPGTRS